jgi:hypothetical protein
MLQKDSIDALSDFYLIINLLTVAFVDDEHEVGVIEL